jgi:undecaprenyl-diphosphatase
LNASDAPSHVVTTVASIIANAPIPVVPILVAAFWIWGNPSRRSSLVAVGLATLVGQTINLTLGNLYDDPRPFMVGLGHTLIAHPPDNGFPSDHATLIWTVGFGLVSTRAAIKTGIAVFFFGFAVAWSRIYLGIHFPIDMMGSMPVAMICGIFAAAIDPAIDKIIGSAIVRGYDATLNFLRLPERLFPRMPQSTRRLEVGER